MSKIEKTGIFYFTDNDMINDPNIREGLVVISLGKEYTNDGLGGLYRIKKYTNEISLRKEPGIKFTKEDGTILFASLTNVLFSSDKGEEMTNKELTDAFRLLQSNTTARITEIDTDLKQMLVH